MQAFAKQQYGERTYSSLQSILDDPAQVLMSSRASVQLPLGGELDILSASRYPQALTQPYEEIDTTSRKRKATTSDQFYGGIVFADEDNNHSSAAEQEQKSSQKKKKKKLTKRSSANNIDDHAESKKQRGRPRLDTRDENAADRRRTQIRLAQRAYRHRKETTIAALNQKVTDLQNTIEQMNKTFLNFHDNVVDAGILNSHYSLGRQLQAATEEFVQLSKIASPESDDEEEAIARITKGDSKSSSEVNGNIRQASAGQHDGDNKTSFLSLPVRKTNGRRGVSFDRSSPEAEAEVEEPSLTSSNNVDNDPLLDLSQAAWTTDTSNLDGLNDVVSFHATIPELVFPPFYDEATTKYSVERPLKPAYHQGNYTYSFQETTFARRLHRMCLERAFRNLTNPSVDPNYIKRVFRFTFCFSNRKRMLQRFQEMLKRRAGESLENWNVPFFHIGGAGTHFPRRDVDGNPIYPPNMVSPAKAFGPQPWIQVETPRLETSTQEMLENIGFGGVWYDSHDVEEYLKTKGIYPDGQSSFIEVDPSVLPSVKTATFTASEGSSSDRSPLEITIRTPSPTLGGDLTDPIITDPFIVRELGEMFSQPTTLFPTVSNSNAYTTNPAVSTSPSSFSSNMGPEASKQQHNDPWADFNLPTTSPPTFSDTLRRRPGPMTFDVEMFLERMVEESACLGRAPGFRKETIDTALVESLQESF